MRVLVTGAKGFLGAHAAGYFSGRGASVAAMDSWVNRENLAIMLKEFTPDVVLHCAGGSSVARSLEDPGRDHERTVGSTRDLCTTLREFAPHATIVYPSSASVYGNCELIPIPESAPIRPISPYGKHKHEAEEVLRQHATSGGPSVIAFRIFSLYGPGLRKQVVFDACRKIAAGRAAFSGTGNEVRDFLHVRDFLALAGTLAQAARDPFQIVNAGSGHGTAIKDLVGLIAQELASGQPPTFDQKSRPGDPQTFISDNQLALRSGWAPTVSLREGIREFVQWFKASASHS